MVKLWCVESQHRPTSKKVTALVPLCRNNSRAVNELKAPWKWRWQSHCSDDVPDDAPYDERLRCRSIPDRIDKKVITSKHITIFHYITKSEEDFRWKVERGSAGGVSRKWDQFDEIVRYDSTR
jgi:hypothetical protein